VDLWEANREAGMVYMQARGQVIAGMGGAIDLNFTAVKDLMEMYGVMDWKRCWEKVHRCFHVFLKEQRDKQKLEQMRPHGRRH
jgi:hypothetical protein